MRRRLARLDTRLIAFILIAFITIVSLIWYYAVRSEPRVVGWETLKSAQQPFKPGVITNGQPPASFTMALIEPKSHSPIMAKPESRCRVEVSIKIVDTSSPNSDIPPTFVLVKLLNAKTVSPVETSTSYPVHRDISGESPDTSPIMVTGTLSTSVSTDRAAGSKTPVAVIRLTPSARPDAHTYIYSGEIVAPRRSGDHAVVIEARYEIFGGDSADAKSTGPRYFEKSIQGATLHVNK